MYCYSCYYYCYFLLLHLSLSQPKDVASDPVVMMRVNGPVYIVVYLMYSIGMNRRCVKGEKWMKRISM